MMKIRKVLSLFLAFFFVFHTFMFPVFGEESKPSSPSLSAESAILLEAESGTVVFEKMPTRACQWQALQKS